MPCQIVAVSRYAASKKEKQFTVGPVSSALFDFTPRAEAQSQYWPPSLALTFCVGCARISLPPVQKNARLVLTLLSVFASHSFDPRPVETRRPLSGALDAGGLGLLLVCRGGIVPASNHPPGAVGLH